MQKTAIDVVLLPSPEMAARVIAINQELLKSAERKIILDEQVCLPHISLCMGVGRESQGAWRLRLASPGLAVSRRRRGRSEQQNHCIIADLLM